MIQYLKKNLLLMVSILKNPGLFQNNSVNISSKIRKQLIANNVNSASSNHDFKIYLKNEVNCTTFLDPSKLLKKSLTQLIS